MKEFKSWNVHRITTTNPKNNFYDDTKNFYELLKLEHQKHISAVENETNKFREVATIKSPMTLFNGNWGSGKTFFIENFKHNFPGLNSDGYFVEFLYIDAMEILEDSDVILQLIKMMSATDTEFGSEVKKSLDKAGLNPVVKGAVAAGSVLVAGLIEKITGVDVKEAYNTGKNVFDEANNNTSNDCEIKLAGNTLIFIDNLERIGKESKKILKAVYKMRSIDNLFFVLISNVSKMQNIFNSQEESNEEFPIYKFVNTSVFDFDQDYSSILIKNIANISNDEKRIINNSLNNTDDGEQLSIRQFSRWTTESGFWKINSKLGRIKLISTLDNVDVKPEIKREYRDGIVSQKSSLEEICWDFIAKIRIISDKFYNFGSNENFDYFQSKVFNSENHDWIERINNEIKTPRNLSNNFQRFDTIIESIADEFSDLINLIKEEESAYNKNKTHKEILVEKLDDKFKDRDNHINNKTEEFKLTIKTLDEELETARKEENIDKMRNVKFDIESVEALLESVSSSNEVNEFNKSIEELKEEINDLSEKIEASLKKINAFKKIQQYYLVDVNSDKEVEDGESKITLIYTTLDSFSNKLSEIKPEYEELDIQKCLPDCSLETENEEFIDQLLFEVFK